MVDYFCLRPFRERPHGRRPGRREIQLDAGDTSNLCM